MGENIKVEKKILIDKILNEAKYIHPSVVWISVMINVWNID
jgi:hypothetical protein